jgi:hypothetical protein
MQLQSYAMSPLFHTQPLHIKHPFYCTIENNILQYLNVKLPIDAERGLGGFRVTYAVLICNILPAVPSTIYCIRHRGTTAIRIREQIL